MAVPTDVANLFAWYRADAITGKNDGDAVSSWTDSSGNGRTMTASGNGTYKTNQIAGKPVVRFTFGATSFYNNTNFNWYSALSAYTAFAVFKTTTYGNGCIIASNGGSGSEGLMHSGSYYVSARSYNAFAQYSNYYADTALQPGLDVWCFGMAQQSGRPGTYGSSLNGGNTYSVYRPNYDTYPSNTHQGYLGVDGGGYWAGDLAEVFIYGAYLGSTDLALIYDYLDAKYFNVVPTQNDRVREVISRRLWLLRRANGIYQVTIPLGALGSSDILDRIAYESRLGPDASGDGWKQKPWQRRDFTIQRMEIDPMSMTARLDLLDRRPLDILLWDTGQSNVSGLASADSSRQVGVAKVDKGNDRVFSRTTKAWVVNPQDASSCVEVDSSRPAIDINGELFEEARTNIITRSSFVSGTTGWTFAGTGVNGSTIAVDGSDLFFNYETGVEALKFTAGTTHTTDLSASIATSTVSTNTNLVFSCDHKASSATYPLKWKLLRAADSKYWNESLYTWSTTATWNSMGGPTQRLAEDRFVSEVFSSGVSSTFALYLGLPSGGTGSRTGHLYHVQLEAGLFATSRIMTDGATYTRAEPKHQYTVTTNDLVYNPDIGTFYCEYIPDFSSGDLAGTEEFHVFSVDNGWGNKDRLYYSNGQLIFERDVSGTVYQATLDQELWAGETYEVACRWQATGGELDQDDYTISVFCRGARGTDDTAEAQDFFIGAVGITDPTEVDGLLGWWSADSIAGLSSGSAVATWSDQSGGSLNWTQGTSTNQPTYQTNVVNGKPVVRFDGTSDYMTLSGTISSTAGEIFVVFKSDAVASTKDGLYDFGSAAANNVHIPYHSNGLIYDDFGSTVRKDAISTAVSVTTWHVYNVRSASGLWQCQQNTTSLTSITSNTVGWRANPVIGGSTISSWNYLDGDIAEIVLFDEILSSTNRRFVLNYLADKYDISGASDPIEVDYAYLTFGGDVDGANPANGVVRNRRIYPYTMTDDELENMEA